MVKEWLSNSYPGAFMYPRLRSFWDTGKGAGEGLKIGILEGSFLVFLRGHALYHK